VQNPSSHRVHRPVGGHRGCQASGYRLLVSSHRMQSAPTQGLRRPLYAAESFGNSPGAFRRWGQIRGLNERRKPDPLTDAELKLFLDTYTGEGCGSKNCRNSPKGPLTRFKNQVAEGCSRHDTMASVLPWTLSEAMAGCYSAREAIGELGEAFTATFTDADDPVRRNN
jgi:hypothetical protein